MGRRALLERSASRQVCDQGSVNVESGFSFLFI